MQRNLILITALLAAGLGSSSRATDPAASVVYSVDTAKVERTAAVGVYGQFLEHIFNSVHGGLWGDMILNPSLETNGHGWMFKDDTVTLHAAETNKQLRYGDMTLGDYDLSLEARRDAGSGGFVVLFRAGDAGYYGADFGSLGNREHRIEKNGKLLATPLAKPIAKLNVPGSIETGRWYRVRIACRGAKFTVWLDDAKLFEFEDTEQPLLRGGIGLNTMYTLASFRNISVTDPAGKVLMARLPTAEEIIPIPAYWKQCSGKPGSVVTEKEGAFSEATSLVLHPDKSGGECGLSQGPKSLAKDETYRGSLWLRAPKGSSASVVFRVRDGKSGVVFEQAFENLPAEWTKREFSFKSPADLPEAVFEVAAKAKEGEGSASVDMINLFSQSSLATGGFRPDLLAAIKALKPASIRYPGGSFIEHYRWKDTVGPREKRRYYIGEMWEDRDASQFGTDEFMELCRQTGAEPVIPVPIRSNDPASVQEAVDWLEYCNGPADSKWGRERAANGHPAPYNVKIWEIGNEEWRRTPEKYAEALIKFSKAMKAKDPSIKIAACGAYGYDNGPSLCDGWNQKVIKAAAKEMDLLSLHYYNGIGYPAMDCAKDPRNYEEYIRSQIGPVIRASANPGIKVYCSEWGQMNIDWRSGLYTAGLLNGFERLGSDLFAMSCPAVWLQAVSSRTNPAPRWASSHILFDHRSWCGVPVYVVQKVWRDHFGPKVVHIEGPSEPLNVLASTSEDGRTLFFKAANPAEKECQVELKVSEAFKAASAELTLIAPGDLKAMNTLDRPDRVEAVVKPVAVTGQSLRFTLPAQSVGALRVK